MRSKDKPVKNKRHGSHRVAANHHRRVHKGVSAAVVAIWLLAAVLTAFTIGSYIDSRRHVQVSNSDVTIQADKVSYDDVGHYPFVPGKGYEFVIVHVSVTNHRDTAFDFAPVVQTYLQDNKQAKYYMAPADLKDPIAAGKLAPGESRGGSLSYLVPAGASGLSFHFQP